MLGGFDVTSKTTLLIPLTLFIILLEIDYKNFLSKLKKSAVIPSSEVIARSKHIYS